MELLTRSYLIPDLPIELANRGVFLVADCFSRANEVFARHPNIFLAFRAGQPRPYLRILSFVPQFIHSEQSRPNPNNGFGMKRVFFQSHFPNFKLCRQCAGCCLAVYAFRTGLKTMVSESVTMASIFLSCSPVGT